MLFIVHVYLLYAVHLFEVGHSQDGLQKEEGKCRQVEQCLVLVSYWLAQARGKC